jgi:flagellar hook protein FlgE
MGWKLDPAGNPIGANNPTSTASLSTINTSGVGYAAEPTTTASITANLSADTKVGGTFASSIPVYDSLGASHSLQLGFERMEQANLSGALDSANPPAAKTLTIARPDGTTTTLTLNFAADAAGAWTLTPAVSGASITSGTVPLTFDASGALTGSAGSEMAIDWGNGSNSRLALDLADLTAGTGNLTAAMDGNMIYRMTASTGRAGDTVTSGASSYVTFDSTGKLVSPASASIGVDWSNAASNAAESTISLALGTPGQGDGLSGLSGASAVRATDQNGLAAGAFTGVSVDKTGKVIAQFDNGQTRAIYQIPVAQFVNPDGLEAVSGNAYRASADAGSFALNASGSGGAGDISSNALEGSTVDLAGEFSSMIITQRAYSANATVITTADEMLKVLDQLKR